VAGCFAGAVSIGSFEVSRWRDGRGDLPMGFQSAPDGLCGYWIGEGRRIGLRGRWFQVNWRPGRQLQKRFVRVVGAARTHAGVCVREHDSVKGG